MRMSSDTALPSPALSPAEAATRIQARVRVYLVRNYLIEHTFAAESIQSGMRTWLWRHSVAPLTPRTKTLRSLYAGRGMLHGARQDKRNYLGQVALCNVVGIFKVYRPHGFGLANHDDGLVEFGYWRNGRRDGFVTLVFPKPCNTRINAIFENGAAHGPAQIRLSNGDIFRCWYTHGQRNAHGLYVSKATQCGITGDWKIVSGNTAVKDPEIISSSSPFSSPLPETFTFVPVRKQDNTLTIIVNPFDKSKVKHEMSCTAMKWQPRCSIEQNITMMRKVYSVLTKSAVRIQKCWRGCMLRFVLRPYRPQTTLSEFYSVARLLYCPAFSAATGYSQARTLRTIVNLTKQCMRAQIVRQRYRLADMHPRRRVPNPHSVPNLYTSRFPQQLERQRKQLSMVSYAILPGTWDFLDDFDLDHETLLRWVQRNAHIDHDLMRDFFVSDEAYDRFGGEYRMRKLFLSHCKGNYKNQSTKELVTCVLQPLLLPTHGFVAMDRMASSNEELHIPGQSIVTDGKRVCQHILGCYFRLEEWLTDILLYQYDWSGQLNWLYQMYLIKTSVATASLPPNRLPPADKTVSLPEIPRGDYKATRKSARKSQQLFSKNQLIEGFKSVICEDEQGSPAGAYLMRFHGRVVKYDRDIRVQACIVRASACGFRDKIVTLFPSDVKVVVDHWRYEWFALAKVARIVNRFARVMMAAYHRVHVVHLERARLAKEAKELARKERAMAPRPCRECNQRKRRDGFSASQWTKANNKRTCIDCLEAAAAEEQRKREEERRRLEEEMRESECCVCFDQGIVPENRATFECAHWVCRTCASGMHLHDELHNCPMCRRPILNPQQHVLAAATTP